MRVKWKQTEKQAEAWGKLLDKITLDLIFGGGAGGAKSYLGCGWLIIMCGKYPGTRWLMGRKKLKRLKATTLNTFFDVCKQWGIKKDVHYKYTDDVGIFWNNGSEILIQDLDHKPSDPNYDDLGSLELTGVFVDEVNQITHKCKQVLTSRIRYRLDEYGLIPKFLGTCNPSKGWVYTEYYKPFKDGTLEKASAFVRALAKDNPFVSKHYVEQLRRIKDTATRERLLNGNWEYDDDPACLFSYEVIQDLFTNKAKNRDGLYISGDVSRKGRDNMPIGLWKGLQLVKVKKIPDEIRASTKKSAYWIMKWAQAEGVRFSHIVLDEDGVGGGVVDNIPGCVGFINNSSPIISKQDEIKKKQGLYFENYGNLKAQCYFKLAELAEQGQIGISKEAMESDDKEALIEDLGQVKQKDIDKDGKIYLIGKDQIKENIGRSPDFSDMLMMRMIYEVKPMPRLSISVI